MTRINAAIFESIKKDYPELRLYQGVVSGRIVERLYDKNHEVVASAVKNAYRIRYCVDLNKLSNLK